MKKLNLVLVGLAVSAVATGAMANVYVQLDPTTCKSVQPVYQNAYIFSKGAPRPHGSTLQYNGLNASIATTDQLSRVKLEDLAVVKDSSGVKTVDLSTQANATRSGALGSATTFHITCDPSSTTQPFTVLAN